MMYHGLALGVLVPLHACLKSFGCFTSSSSCFCAFLAYFEVL